MQEKQPLLSICIPTYNRAECLQKSIESIICQPEFQNGDVEIAISDNASTDDTEALGRSYADRFPNISYHRQAVGTPIPDMNFPLVLSYGTGVLRKLSNDNSVYKTDALRFLCGTVRMNMDRRPVMFFRNSKDAPIDVPRLGFEAFVYQCSYFMTWIGGYSAWDHECVDIAYDTEYCRTHLWQVERILRFLPISGGKFYTKIFCGGLPRAKRKKDLTFGVFQTYYNNYFQLIQPYYDKGMLSKECMDFLKKDLLQVLSYHMIFQDTEDDYIIFNEKENLRELVFDTYRKESYFPAFQKAYLDLIRDYWQAKDHWQAFFHQHPSFYLYGTGKIARTTLAKLQEEGREPAGCLVSPGHKAADDWNGIAVHDLDELRIGKQDGILVSVGVKLQPEVRDVLRKYGLERQSYFLEFPRMREWM